MTIFMGRSEQVRLLRWGYQFERGRPCSTLLCNGFHGSIHVIDGCRGGVLLGLPPGLGSFSQWDRRLDGRIAQALMSIHAVKAVSLGAGFEAGATSGAHFHDEILYDDSAGGLHRVQLPQG